MVTRRVWLGSAGAVLAQALISSAQTAAGGRKVLFEHALPDLNLQNWSVTAVEVSYAPGETSARLSA